MTVRYCGNGPYCTANSLSMIFGAASPGPEVIEVVSGTPFGMTLHGDDLPYWSSSRWTPEDGMNAAIDLLGWTCTRTCGSRDEAVAVLRSATQERPVLAGPLEMGLLPYIPGLGQAIGADHVLVVTGMDGDTVLAHDAQGWPFVTVPLESLLAAWQGDTFVYDVEPYAVRHEFRQVRRVDPQTALRRSLPAAARYGAGTDSADAANRLAQIIEGGLTTMQYKYMVEFTVQGGARRIGDAGSLLREIGCTVAGDILIQQATLVGSLQYPLVKGEKSVAASILRKLAPTYEPLHAALVDSIVDDSAR